MKVELTDHFLQDLIVEVHKYSTKELWGIKIENLCKEALRYNVENYANQKVIGELEAIGNMPMNTSISEISKYINERFKELKQ